MKKCLTVAFMLVAVSWASASNAGYIYGKLMYMYMMPPPNNHALFRIVGTIGGTPGCNINNEFAVSLAQPAGRLLVQQLLHAQTMGYSISVWGTNACDVWGDRETVSYIGVAYP